jgi:hypothetical protein
VVLGASRTSIQELANLVDESLAFERLCDVAVGARIPRSHFVERLERPRQEKHRDSGECGIVLDRFADLVTVLLRHHDVGEHDVGAQFLRLPDCVIAVVDSDDAEVLAGKRDPDHLLNRDRVVREQKVLGHGNPVAENHQD